MISLSRVVFDFYIYVCLYMQINIYSPFGYLSNIQDIFIWSEPEHYDQ